MVVMTTLAENRYFNGVAALVNSILKQGCYVDKIIVGYRGELPEWLPKLNVNERSKYFQISEGPKVEFIELQGDLHMVHEKPKWLDYFTNTLEPNADEYFFFDSDIIVINRMSFFGEWVKEGVALCEDVNYDMSSSHPIRKQWIRLAEGDKKEVLRSFERYFNSGFLGWNKETKKFILDWLECSKLMNKISGDLKQFRVNDRTKTVLSSNQDSLNLAAMVTECEVSVIGPEAMGFHYGLKLMLHPLGQKPWDINFTINFFRGIKPRLSDLRFWQHANTSIFKPYSRLYVYWKIFLIRGFRFLSRLYG